MSLIVKLNGSNYVSEKRRAAIEEVLNRPAPVVERGNGKNGGSGGNGHHSGGNGGHGGNGHHPAPTAVSAPVESVPPAPSLGQALDHLFAHQEATLRVHESYLRNQGEYARLFSRLLEQQGRIFAEGKGDPQRTQAAVQVITELSRSMARFHEMQREALNLHRSFLTQQAEYGRAYLQLLQTTPYPLDAVHPAPAPAPVPTAPSPVVSAPAELEAEFVPDWDEEPPAAAPADAGQGPSRPPAHAEEAQEAGHAPADLKAALLEIVAEKTGYPPEMLDLTMDMEADLGIDSIKRVEILAALQERFPDLPEIEADELAELRTLGEILAQVEAVPAGDAPSHPPARAEEVREAGRAPADLKAVLLEIVAEKTGYPPEMLDLTMDMEADLGIDSIKRVEILAALQERFPDLPEIEADELAELRTLEEILARVGDAGGNSAPSVLEEEHPKA